MRVHDIDALRGFALLGIFVVNVTFMASGYPGNLVDNPAFGGVPDHLAQGVVSVFFGMKFYLLFAFLFGYSFTLQSMAADRAGAAFRPRMVRRIVGLFLLGVLNIVLLYSGDVLTTYAVACLILLALWRVKDRTAIVVAAVLYALVIISMLAGIFFVDRSVFLPDHAQALQAAAEQTHAMLGSLGSIIGTHLDGLPLLIIQAVSTQGPTALAMFLIGMVAGRHKLLSGVTGDEPLLARMQLWGLAIGLPGGVAFALLGGDANTTAALVGLVTAPFLTAGYVATLLRLMHNPRTARVRNWLAPAGRIALTNYLTQSVVGLLIFSGLGLGLAGRFSPSVLLGVAAVVFAAQLMVSAWWLRYFRYGPAEWVLRWLTNARRPTWRHGGDRTSDMRSLTL